MAKKRKAQIRKAKRMIRNMLSGFSLGKKKKGALPLPLLCLVAVAFVFTVMFIFPKSNADDASLKKNNKDVVQNLKGEGFYSSSGEAGYDWLYGSDSLPFEDIWEILTENEISGFSEMSRKERAAKEEEIYSSFKWEETPDTITKKDAVELGKMLGFSESAVKSLLFSNNGSNTVKEKSENKKEDNAVDIASDLSNLSEVIPEDVEETASSVLGSVVSGVKDKLGDIVAGSSDESGYLEVHFIDVGQGDAVLCSWIDEDLSDGNDSEYMLVDAGDNSKGTLVRNYLSKQGVEELKYFVCTHPDADHIGGAASVISNIPISSEVVFGPSFEKDTKTYNNMMNEISSKSYSYKEPKYIRTSYELGGASFTFIAPTEKHNDVNSNSLVLMLSYSGKNVLLVGDCEEEEEDEIVSNSKINSKLIDCDVLKVGHHGSKTSSSKEFLELCTPEYAVISCGDGNDYHHPHAAALNNLREVGSKLYRTDEQGSLIATVKDSEIIWNAAPCDNWTPGE